MMNSELSVILQNSPNLIQTGLDEDTLAVAGGAINTGNKRISIRGKAFRKVVGGKEVSISENNYMDIVIVKMAHTASRTFYAQSYKEGEKISPTCWSSDSRVPDIDVKVHNLNHVTLVSLVQKTQALMVQVQHVVSHGEWRSYYLLTHLVMLCN